MRAPDHDPFVRVVRALAAYRDQLVIVGGTGHRLLGLHPQATPSAMVPLTTEDADIATPERLRERRPSIDEALTSAGLVADLSGSGSNPTCQYRFPDRSDLYIEFIAPLRGARYKRNGEPDDTLRISGVLAAKLRYVDLLLFEPWELELEDDVAVRVVNPASYILQKLLVIAQRPPRKRYKDLLYVHDTLVLFRHALGVLRAQASRVLDQVSPTRRLKLPGMIQQLLGNRALAEQAAAIAVATGRAAPPSAASIIDVCSVGLDELFGSARR